MKTIALALLLVLPSTLSYGQSQNPPSVRVTLDDGRMLVGQVDDATNLESLWIRRSEGPIVLATPYAWKKVTQVQVDGKPMNVKAFRENYQQLAVAWPENFLFATHEGAIFQPVHGNALLSAEHYNSARVESLAVEAVLANWDADVEPDGYELAIALINSHGQLVPVRGTLRAKLIGERTNRTGQPVPGVELERWTERIDLADFAEGVALYRLPFWKIDPEQQVSLAPGAILQVEVGAFGHGDYAASIAVPTREFNPVRDRMQQQTGRRFFRGERTLRPSR